MVVGTKRFGECELKVLNTCMYIEPKVWDKLQCVCVCGGGGGNLPSIQIHQSNLTHLL